MDKEAPGGYGTATVNHAAKSDRLVLGFFARLVVIDLIKKASTLGRP
ncbi:MAG: hypothetical protein ACR2OR_16510 [Hyphomicrobiales bacterium]